MAQKIFQLENNEILITDGQNTYSDIKDNFAKDYSTLELKNDLIIYNPTLKLHVIDGQMQDYQTQSEFDTCIDSVQKIIDAKTTRTAAVGDSNETA